MYFKNVLYRNVTSMRSRALFLAILSNVISYNVAQWTGSCWRSSKTRPHKSAVDFILWGHTTSHKAE